MNKRKIIITGGGTGGHIFPALAIAEQYNKDVENTEILFVGAQDRMEMNLIPQYGYKIIGLPIKPLPRKISLDLLKNPYFWLKSYSKAKKILKEFQPDAVIGVGGYASFPMLLAAQMKKIPTFIQEQNSFLGVANKILAKNAVKIFVAFRNLEYCYKNAIFTGNPLRSIDINLTKKQAIEKFGLSENFPILLVTGGSLGARTINEAIFTNLNKVLENNIQLIWQTGKYYYDDYLKKLEKNNVDRQKFVILPFIQNMYEAYNAADLVIARAGAITISELSLLGKACILVPSPNVAEDHQTKNALELVKNNAAIMIKDSEAVRMLIDKAIETLKDKKLLVELSSNIKNFSNPLAAKAIVDNVEKFLKNF